MKILLSTDTLFRQDAALQNRVRTLMDDTRIRITDLLKAAMTEGVIRADLDADSAALMLIGGFRMLVSGCRMGSPQGSLEDRTRRYADAAIRLMKGN